MSVGRNWTRRSIEELVDFYLRKKKATGDVPVPAILTNLIPMVLGNADPDNYGRIMVGAYSSSLVDNWYRPLSDVSQKYPHFLEPWAMYGDSEDSSQYPRYDSISGTAGVTYATSATGELVEDGETAIKTKKFAVMIFPKTCSFEFLKKIVVTSNGFNAISSSITHWGMVTCDPINEYNMMDADDALIRRTMYLPLYNDQIADGQTVPFPVKLDRGSFPYELNMSPLTSTSHLNVNAGVVDNEVRTLSLYPNFITKYPTFRSYLTYNTDMSGTAKTRSNTFVNGVIDGYDGTMLKDDVTYDMNCIAIIVVDGSSREEIESDIFKISRLVLDNCYWGSFGLSPDTQWPPKFYSGGLTHEVIEKGLPKQIVLTGDKSKVQYTTVQI